MSINNKIEISFLFQKPIIYSYTLMNYIQLLWANVLLYDLYFTKLHVHEYLDSTSQSHMCSVMSDSLKLHGLQPARFLCLQDFSGKNTGVGCHFLLQGIFLTQRSNPHFLHLLKGKVDSLPLSHLGSPELQLSNLSSMEVYHFLLLGYTFFFFFLNPGLQMQDVKKCTHKSRKQQTSLILPHGTQI